ncbi:MAG: anti-sigma factor [Dehalococcoidia bacterium]|nr:anti-sigma factor [Dehalococcoidia bacterium]
MATAGAGAAAVFVAIAAFTGMISVRGQINDLRKENVALQDQIRDALSQKIEIAALTQRLSEEERPSSELRSATRSDRDLLLAIMSPDSDTAEVFGVNDYASALGRLVWDEQQRRLWFIASRLPALPEGQTYQIWVSSGGRYASLGTFNSDASGFARYETLVPQGLKSYESAVVTIERAGGAPERSGQSAFVTDLSRLRR